VLHYYLREGGEEMGAIELTQAQRVERAPECKFQPALKVDFPDHAHYFVFDTREEVDDWIEAMNAVCFPAYLS
jgi:hypothetical protein